MGCCKFLTSILLPQPSESLTDKSALQLGKASLLGYMVMIHRSLLEADM